MSPLSLLKFSIIMVLTATVIIFGRVFQMKVNGFMIEFLFSRINQS